MKGHFLMHENGFHFTSDENSDDFARKTSCGRRGCHQIPAKTTSRPREPRDKNLTLHEGNIKNYLEFFALFHFFHELKSEIWLTKEN